MCQAKSEYRGQKTEGRKQMTAGQRLLIGAILPAMAAGFAFLHLAAVHKWVFYPFPCGFKEQFGLPCPTCGMTTSVLAFANGQILRAFYVQPAAAVMCCMLICAGLTTFVMAITGTDWGLVRNIKLKYIIVTLIVIVGGGWAVTLARAFAGRIAN